MISLQDSMAETPGVSPGEAVLADLNFKNWVDFKMDFLKKWI